MKTLTQKKQTIYTLKSRTLTN